MATQQVLYLREKFESMKSAKYFFVALSVFIAAACGNPAPDNSGATTTTDTTATTPPPPRATHDCKVAGKMLDEGASIWIRSQEILVAVTADSSTFDADYGDSYRVLEVYDTRNCSLLERKVLPVNVSPDFPYYVAEISYNKVHEMAAVRGFNSIYLYDAENRRWLPELKPKFASARSGADAQSGMIQRLELWEDYLIGYAQDFGAFAFTLADKAKPAPVLALAEYKPASGAAQSLFLLPVQGAFQAISPSYNADAGTFSVNPMLDAPIALKTDIQKSAANNRYIVLRENTSANTAYAFDLAKNERVALPAEVAAQPTQEVLAWIRANRK